MILFPRLQTFFEYSMLIVSVHWKHCQKYFTNRSGPGYGLTFTPDDLQEMSARALDILKRFVDENTMLRKEVIRLQDESVVDGNSYFQRTGPKKPETADIASLRDVLFCSLL